MPRSPLDPPQLDLRLTPEQIPQMRKAVEQAIEVISQAVKRVRADGHIREPWLGDETSAAFVNYFNATMMDSPNSPRAHFEAFEQELLRVHQALVTAERNYADAETGARAGIVTRMAPR